MTKFLSGLCALMAVLWAPGALAGSISDTGTTAYWGADGHNYGDVIGASTYNINGATITRVGSVLTVTIATNFAGHAGIDSWAAPGGIAYGDVFLASAWNPFGTDAHHTNDKASNGTDWAYGLNLDNRYSNTGGTFKLYQLTGTNAQDIKNSDSFLTSGTYRNGQAVAVNTASSTAHNTGLTGLWTVTADQQLKFTINIASSADLMSFKSFAMHWGETCQNDVIEGVTSVVPEPGSLALIGLSLAGVMVVRRKRALATA